MSCLGNELLVNDTVVSSLPLPLPAPIAGLPPGLGLVLHKNLLQKYARYRRHKKWPKRKNKTGQSVKINVFTKNIFSTLVIK
jgi:hypothetical protein